MIIATERFGELDVAEKDVIVATSPIPGFPKSTQFFFLQKDSIRPFKWMQSVQEPNLTFVVVEPQYFFHDYAPEISIFDSKEIGTEKVEDIDVVVIVVLPEDMTQMTANLKGPIIINKVSRKMKQVFLETDKWTVRESIIEAIKRKESFDMEMKLKAEKEKNG